MQKGTVVDLTASLAIAASKLSMEHNLPMADSIILATAQEFNAIIWTQDSDFKAISNVKYFPKEIKMANQSIHRTLDPRVGDLFVSPQSYGIGHTRKLR